MYCSSLTSITIPDSVNSIGSNAFSATGLTSVTIPDSVETIESGAFSGCSNLKSVILPKNITTLSADLFSGCEKLTDIEIPQNVTKIDTSAFNSCKGLKSITIPENVVEIGGAAFKYCTGLTCAVIPNCVKTIGSGAFSYCSGLISVSIPNSVEVIGDEAFKYCTALTGITIPSGVATIEEYAFYNCTKLSIINLPDSLSVIGRYAFSGTAYYNNELNWEDDVLYIGNHFILANTDISGELVIKPGTVTIADYACYGCSELSSVALNTVSNIGEYSFYNCVGLSDVSIPDGVKTVARYSFCDCKGLENIVISDSVTTIGEFAFYDCASLTEIVLGNNVADIEEFAFANCELLEKIYIPKSVKNIQADAFKKCWLTDVYYAGNEDEWKEIYIYNVLNSNSSLINATMHYNYIPPCEVHSYDDGVITKYPDCVSAGIKTYTCTVCNTTKTEEVPTDGKHYYVDGYCTGCGEKDPNYVMPSISVGERNINISKGGTEYYATFTAETNGTLTFYSNGYDDTYGYLYDNNMELLTQNDDGGEGNNFNISYKLEAGKTYVLSCKFYSNSETGTISITVEFEKAHIHIPLSPVIENEFAPSCSYEGAYDEVVYCAICGEELSRETETVDALGHDFGEWQITESEIPATCKEKGKTAVETRICSRDASHIETRGGEEIAMLEHTPAEAVKDNEVPSSCTAKGSYDEVVYCSVCGEELSREDKTTEKLAHTPASSVKENIVPATYDKAGSYDSVVYCSVCCEELSRTKVTVAKLKKTSLAKATVSGIADKTYTGKSLTQSVTVKLGSKTLKNGTDYTATYKNNKNVGKATVTITGVNAYSGTITKTFKINPKATTLSKVTEGKKSFTATWKKQATQTTGYQIQYSTDKNFKKGNKTVTVSKNSTTKTTVKKLTAKKKYYVRIRTYKTVSGTKYYSSWSKAKTVTTKK